MKIRQSTIYLKLTETPLADLDASDVYDAINGIRAISPEMLDYVRFLKDLLQVLQVDQQGLNMVPSFEADGTLIKGEVPWIAFPPFAVVANAEGNPGAAELIIAAPGAGHLDIMMMWKGNTAGNYLTRFCEDAEGTPAVTFPDYFTTPLPVYSGGHIPLELRICTVTAGKSFGRGVGVNGDYPNNGVMQVWGWYRVIV